VYNSFAALKGFPTLPDYNFKIPLPAFLSEIKRPLGFAAAYRSLTNDLSTIWSLGEARDILGARVAKDNDAVAYNPKSETPQYRNAHSQFKSPM